MNRARFYTDTGVPMTESLLLQVLVEIGIIGLLGFMLFVLYVVKTGIRLFRQAALDDRPQVGCGGRSWWGIWCLVQHNCVLLLSLNDWSVSSVFWLLATFITVTKGCANTAQLEREREFTQATFGGGMLIAVDLLPITGRNAGLQTYAGRLVESLARVDHETEYLLLVNSRVQRLFEVPRSNFSTICVKTPKRFIGYWEQLSLPVMSALRRVDLLHSPVSAPPLRVPCKTVVTVHDLTFRLYPQTMQRWDRFYWDYFISWGLRRASRIIIPSQSKKRDLVKLLGVPEQLVSIVYEYCAPRFFDHETDERIISVKQRFGIQGRYVLYVGTLEPRKNVPMLLRAFHLAKRMAGTDY